ncbi:nucleoid-associated protein [Sedimentibacter sp. zth1]|uniref:nucleoid-associated protein n=1 Tax=Sedimentibacter sp. zth1 TaxID=2816908 RepID=UPI001A91C916|nr:nucleoid-associated protein [Sedimentibacter sp. zth1]QSX05483.1 nucleoid-associated protein [Sedimentibacter sp. zth1]
METNIIIHKAIVHILDMSVSSPILSDNLLEVDDDMFVYIAKHIEKIMFNPSSKKYKLSNTTENCEKLLTFEAEKFIEITQELSKNIFDIMKKCTDINSCDLLFCLYETENIKKLCMLKLSYKESYIHRIDDLEGKRLNRIIKYKSTLPSASQKSDENFIYEIENQTLFINEKKYEIEEERATVFSNFVFNQPFTLSPKETYDAIDKVSKKMVKEYFDNNIEKKINIKKEIVDSFNSKGTIDLNKITDTVFEADSQVKQVYNEELKSTGIKDEKVKLDYKLDKNINKKQKIKTEEGIEIVIPVEYLDNTDKISFNTNEDGTVNIVLKSLNNLG